MNKLTLPLYFLLIALLCVYSYVLVDPNITFLQNPLWVQFREIVIQIGYYRRDISWLLYAIFAILLYMFHVYMRSHYAKVPVLKIAGVIGVILVFSYPFLSHDLFNYMFDARILTFYGKNPYAFKALDFPFDQWTRFMHWTHRSYPYGPVFLVLSFAPSFIGLGKFTLTFLLFKSMFVAFYLLAVRFLLKMDRQWAVVFATHPLVIIEGLVSAHNDLIAVGLAIIGLYYILKKSGNWWGRVFLVCSGGIKYTTLASVALMKGKPAGVKGVLRLVFGRWNEIVLLVQIAVLVYLAYRMGIQPWYFLTLFAYLPILPGLIRRLDIFFFGLLVSYYPYIRMGGWDTTEKVSLRHQIIAVFIFLNALYLIIKSLRYSSHLQMEFKKSDR